MMLKRSRLTKAEVQSQCLQVERANIKSNARLQKRELQLKEFTRFKTTMRMILRAWPLKEGLESIEVH